MYGVQKAKGLFSVLKYQKFQASISKWDVLFKNDQMLWFVKKPNEKLQRFVIIFLWEVIYAHFYNWDSPLDLVLVVYDLIELIIETSVWSKDYSTFDTHPQHTSFSSINVYFICVIVHAQIWCVCLITCWSNPKIFLSILYVFESNFIFCALSFCSKCIFVLFFKNLFRGIFVRSSRLRVSCKKSSREIWKSHFHIESIMTVSQVFHDQAFPAKWFLGKSWKNTSFI